MVIADTPVQSLHQLGAFFAGLSSSQIGELFRVASPSMSACRMARPLLPSTSDSTLPSLRFASSSTFWMREEC